MKRVLALCILGIIAAASSVATTGKDLSSRITIDGDVSDFADDEWVLDATTSFPERPRDSRWGTDNDIQRIGVTWDDNFFYVAVPAVTLVTNLMFFIDSSCDGARNLRDHAVFRQNVEFGDFAANFILTVNRTRDVPRAGFGDCFRPFNTFDPDDYASAYVQEGTAAGALEVAIPWGFLGDFVPSEAGTLTPVRGQTIAFLAAIVAGPGLGAGDAGPDPTTALENDSTRVAILNNHITVPLDANPRDGILDTGVSPRAVATYARPFATGTREVLPVRLTLENKAFAPETGEVLSFVASLDPAASDTTAVYLTANVYSAAGELLRNIYRDEPRNLSAGATPVVDEWDGRDNHGNLVPGGIYILSVSGGPGQGASKNTAKASCAVIR